MTRIGVILVLLAVAIPATAGANVKRYAIVIGNNAAPRGETGLSDLHYADDDAVRYYQFVKRLGAESVLLTVLDRDTQRRYPELPVHVIAPTRANLDKAVEGFANQVARDRQLGDSSVFYFIFAGHGAVAKGQSYLALVDARVTQEVLYEQILAKVPADSSHVIIDACNATGVVGSRGLFDKELHAQPVALSVEQLAGLGRLKQYPNVGILLATTFGEKAHEWHRIESGVFSHEVLSGLSGAADVNRDGAIEYSEIQAFVAAANRKLNDRRAAPKVIAIPPAVNDHAPLAVLSEKRGVAWLEGNASELGHFYVELERGQRYLDAHVASGVPVRIAVPARESLYVRTEQREVRVQAPGEGDVIKLAKLDLQDRKVAERGSLEADLHHNLFSAAFTKNYYDGFVDSSGVVPVSFEKGALSYDVVRSVDQRRKRQAIGLVSTSAAAFGATAIATGIMIKAKHDAENPLQAPSQQAESRFKTARVITITSAVISVAAGVTGAILWPKKKKADFSVDYDPRTKGYSVSARLRF